MPSVNKLTFFSLLLFALSQLFSQDLPITTAPLNDQCNNIRNYLTRVAREITDNSLKDIHSLTDWQAVRSQRYQEFLQMMSLVNVPVEGPRPPLNIKKTGEIQKDGYKIVKLYYESLPGLYVAANLYVPDNIKKPVPGILYVCGHSPTQMTHYQAHPRKFAQLGFVCLIIETIQWGEVRGDHWGTYSKGWFHWVSRGYNPAGVELWNGIRGLDVLAQMPEVDGQNLGVTGISGGGTQSWYIAAADPRVKAAAPVCGTSTLNAHIYQRTIDGHCDCMWPVNTYLRDFSDIGALIAPRPLLIASANRDGLNTIESVEEIYRKTKKIYNLFGQPENLQLVETPGGHSYHKISRTRIFSFFLKHLFGKEIDPSQVGDIDETESAQLSEEELRVYVDGPPADDRTKTIQDSFVKLAVPPEIRNITDLNVLREKTMNLLKEKTFRAFPQTPPPFNARWVFRTADGAPHGQDIYSFVPETGWRLKVEIRWRNSPGEKSPLLLVLRSPNEKRWESEGFLSGLDDQFNIAYLEIRGIGEFGWSPDLQWHIRRASAWTGRTIASMRVYDVLRCLEFLRNLNGITPDKIVIVGRGEMAVVALYAALLDEQVAGILLQNPPSTQNKPSRPDGRGEAIEMLNCLQITDLPQVAGLLFPKKIAFVGSVPESYGWTKDVYRRLNKADRFQVLKAVTEWHF